MGILVPLKCYFVLAFISVKAVLFFFFFLIGAAL